MDDTSVESSLEGSLEASVEGSNASADGQGLAQGQGLSSSQRRGSQEGEGGPGGVSGEEEGGGLRENDSAAVGGEGQEGGGMENEHGDHYQQVLESEKGVGGMGTGTGVVKRVRYDSVQMRAQQEEEAALERIREIRRQKEAEEYELRSDVPQREWGVTGTWRIPICIKPRASSVAAEAMSMALGGTTTAITITGATSGDKSNKAGGSSSSSGR